MRKLLFGLAAVPFLVSVASATDRLTDLQMDQISAAAIGDIAIGSIGGCSCVYSAGTSVAKNGVTVTTSTTTPPGSARLPPSVLLLELGHNPLSSLP